MGAQALNLPEYVAEVVDSNPLVREQIHIYRQVAQDYEAALSGWRPSFDVEASSSRFSRKSPTTANRRREFNSSEGELNLTQNLFDGFDTTNQIKQARARISSAAYQLLDTADNVALDAVRAYINVLSERRVVQLSAENVEAHERTIAQIQELSSLGISRRSDVEQTEGRLARAHASLIAQQNNLHDAVTELHKQLGRYLAPSDLVDPASPPQPKRELEKLTAEALSAHPAIRSAMNNIQAARFDYRRSKSTDLPSLDLQLQQTLGDNVDGAGGNSSERSVMLNLQYNLYRGGADRAEQRRRLSVMHENQAFLDRVRRQVIDALRLAWTADLALNHQLPYLKRHSEKARETRGLYGEEFLLQKRDLIDVLDAENELNGALIRQAEATYEALAARFRVYEGIGALFPTLNLSVDVTEYDIQISNIQARAVDQVQLIEDRDLDGLPDKQDQCDNSGEGGSIDAYGCQVQPMLKLGYQGTALNPKVSDDTLVARQDLGLTISPEMLLGNDDEGGARLTIDSFTQPSKGTVKSNGGGNLVYAPRAGFTGDDEFSYSVLDTRGRGATAVVRISVEPRPDIPDVEIVRFGYKKLTLTAESQARIDAIIDALKQRPDVRIEISAHTDNIGPELYNLRLSDRRAKAMKRMLIERGIEASQIEAFGAGESLPIADNSTEEGRAKNRRGEFRFKLAP